MATDPPDDIPKLSRIDYDKIEADGPLPPLEAETVRTEMRQELENIRDFVTTEPFLDLVDHVYSLPVENRDEFVRTVILDTERLREEWNVVPPDGIKLQRSQFGDNRPTIFCVVKPLADGIRKVTVTLDSRSALALR
nr:hypothetical protein [Micromonospora sp. DSM 115978]